MNESVPFRKSNGFSLLKFFPDEAPFPFATINIESAQTTAVGYHPGRDESFHSGCPSHSDIDHGKRIIIGKGNVHRGITGAECKRIEVLPTGEFGKSATSIVSSTVSVARSITATLFSPEFVTNKRVPSITIADGCSPTVISFTKTIASECTTATDEPPQTLI